MDWDEELKQGMQAMKDQGDMAMILRVIPSGSLDAMIAAGDQGDMDARTACVAIFNWFDMVNKAHAQGMVPGCGTCKSELRPGTIYGWVVMTPVRKNAIGLVSPLCEPCISLGRDEVIRRFKETLGSELGGTLETIQ